MAVGCCGCIPHRCHSPECWGTNRHPKLRTHEHSPVSSRQISPPLPVAPGQGGCHLTPGWCQLRESWWCNPSTCTPLPLKSHNQFVSHFTSKDQASRKIKENVQMAPRLGPFHRVLSASSTTLLLAGACHHCWALTRSGRDGPGEGWGWKCMGAASHQCQHPQDSSRLCLHTQHHPSSPAPCVQSTRVQPMPFL